MTPLFQKLNFKNHAEICVLNAPESFDGEIFSMRGAANVLTSLEACSKINFILAFVTAKEEVERLVPIIHAKLNGDAIVWFAYVKGTSKRYKSLVSNHQLSYKNVSHRTFRFRGIRSYRKVIETF